MFVEMITIPPLDVTIAHSLENCNGTLGAKLEFNADDIKVTPECDRKGCTPKIITVSEVADV